MSGTQQPEALNLEEFRAKVTRAAREPLLARIEELEAQLSAIGAGGVEPLRGSRHVHECREALAACIKLLKKTPKITRDIYVGKDRQAWGVQAKAVLDAAVAALNQEDEK